MVIANAKEIVGNNSQNLEYICQHKKRQGVHRVKVEIPAKVLEKSDLSSLLDRKTTLFSTHTMNFDMKCRPFTMLSDYCHKVLSDLNITNELEFPI